jgi:hypothetical protein
MKWKRMRDGQGVESGAYAIRWRAYGSAGVWIARWRPYTLGGLPQQVFIGKFHNLEKAKNECEAIEAGLRGGAGVSAKGGAAAGIAGMQSGGGQVAG